MGNLILTIAIPNYNGGENIIRAIKSCGRIGFRADEFEILVVDNASEDGTVNFVRSLEVEFPNIRLVVNKKNIGRIGNWNRCLELAMGEYIMFLFPTEEISNSNNIVSAINKMEGTRIVLAKSDVINKKGFNYACYKGEGYDFKVKNIKRTLRKAIILSGSLPFGPLQSFIFKLDFVKENGIKFDEKYNIVGDQDFIIRIGEKLSNNKAAADYLSTENANIIFDDTVKSRTHNRLSLYSRLHESLDLIGKRQYCRFIGLEFEDILCFVLAQSLLVDKIFGNRRECCGKEIYERDKQEFYKKYRRKGKKVLVFFFLLSWIKILVKIAKIMKEQMKYDIACLIRVNLANKFKKK